MFVFLFYGPNTCSMKHLIECNTKKVQITYTVVFQHCWLQHLIEYNITRKKSKSPIQRMDIRKGLMRNPYKGSWISFQWDRIQGRKILIVLWQQESLLLMVWVSKMYCTRSGHTLQFYFINYSRGVVQLQTPTGQFSHHACRLFDHMCNVWEWVCWRNS